MAERSKEIEKIIDGYTLFDDELMSTVFDENIEATEYLLKTILGRDDIRVISAKGEYSLKSPVIDGKGVRLDVKAVEESGRPFDVEVQNDSEGSHVRRARYNSSMLDSRMLGKDEPYKDMKDSYVIFIYRRDKFRKGLPVYHIDRYVEETGKAFGDGSHIIYVNGRYSGDDNLGRMLHDFKCTKSSELYNSTLAAGIKHFKETEEGREHMSEAVERYAKKYAKKYSNKKAKHTRVSDVKSLMYTMKMTLEQALDALQITEQKERQSIIKAVQRG